MNTLLLKIKYKEYRNSFTVVNVTKWDKDFRWWFVWWYSGFIYVTPYAVFDIEDESTVDILVYTIGYEEGIQKY